jgi:hypothetical protein
LELWTLGKDVSCDQWRVPPRAHEAIVEVSFTWHV